MMLAEIPPPPVPAQSVLAVGAGACAVIGAALLLWGRSLGRVVLAMAAAGAAGASARLIAGNVSYGGMWLVALLSAVTAGFVAFTLARLIWSLALGTLLIAATFGVVFWLSGAPAADEPAWQNYQLPGLAGWCACLVGYLCRWAWSLSQHKAAILAAAGGGPLLVAIAGGMFLPRMTLILTSSFVGAAGVVGAVALGVWAGRPDWMAGWITHAYIPLAAAGLLAALGLFVQTREELLKATQVRAAEAGKETPEDDQAGAKRPAGKTHKGRNK